jgi:hypothetical protein
MPAAPRIVPRPGKNFPLVRTALAPAYELCEAVGTPTDVSPPPFPDVFPDDEPPTPWVGEFALKPAANEAWIGTEPARVVPPCHEQIAAHGNPTRQSDVIEVTEHAPSGERELTIEERDLMPKFFPFGAHEMDASYLGEQSPSQSVDGFRASLTPPLPLVSPVSTSRLTAEDLHAIQRMSRFPPGTAKRAVEFVVLGSVIAVAAFAILACIITLLRTV